MNFRVGVRFGVTACQGSPVADYTGLAESCYFGLRSFKGELGDLISVSFSIPDDVQNGLPKRALQF
ncbi:MAG: hypothetical protein ACJ8NS_05265 [Chthoniobacterales bacterium]